MIFERDTCARSPELTNQYFLLISFYNMSISKSDVTTFLFFSISNFIFLHFMIFGHILWILQALRPNPLSFQLWSCILEWDTCARSPELTNKFFLLISFLKHAHKQIRCHYIFIFSISSLIYSFFWFFFSHSFRFFRLWGQIRCHFNGDPAFWICVKNHKMWKK